MSVHNMFDDPAFREVLDSETKKILEKIEGRTPEEITAGLIKTGVLTPDGKGLTEKYGGTE